MINQYTERLAPLSGHMPRIFTSDQWGDYLTYRFYPRIRVFVDGRSDLFGPTLGKEYIHTAGGQHDWKPCGYTLRSEEHTSELQSHLNLVCRLLLEKNKKNTSHSHPRALPPIH